MEYLILLSIGLPVIAGVGMLAALAGKRGRKAVKPGKEQLKKLT